MRHVIAATAIGVLTIAMMLWVVRPMVDDIFTNVSNDNCEFLSENDPNPKDPDCRNDPWTGVDHVEEYEAIRAGFATPLPAE